MASSQEFCVAMLVVTRTPIFIAKTDLYMIFASRNQRFFASNARKSIKCIKLPSHFVLQNRHIYLTYSIYNLIIN